MRFWCSSILTILISVSTAAQQKLTIDWQQATVLPAAGGAPHIGVAGPLTGVHNNVLIVAGGANFPQGMPWVGGPKVYHDAAYLFTKGPKGNLSVIQTARLPEALAYSASCSTPQGIVCAGGENDRGATDKVLLLQWQNKKFVTTPLPSLPYAFTNAAVTYCDGIVYLAGGENSTEALRHFAYLDMQNLQKGWQTLPTLPQPTSHAVLVVQAGSEGKSIYLIGGRSKTSSGISKLYNQVYAFNLNTKTWREETPLPYALSAASGMAVGPCSILLFSGDRGETFHQTEKLIASIKDEKDVAQKELLNKQKAQLQSNHPGFSPEVLAYHTGTRQWQAVSSLPFEPPVTTTAVCWDSRIYLPSGEVKAGVRTPQVLAARINWKEAPCR